MVEKQQDSTYQFNIAAHMTMYKLSFEFESNVQRLRDPLSTLASENENANYAHSNVWFDTGANTIAHSNVLSTARAFCLPCRAKMNINMGLPVLIEIIRNRQKS
jgi:hypothetical protein